MKSLREEKGYALAIPFITSRGDKQEIYVRRYSSLRRKEKREARKERLGRGNCRFNFHGEYFININIVPTLAV